MILPIKCFLRAQRIAESFRGQDIQSIMHRSLTSDCKALELAYKMT